jgi:RNA polymerase sigma factor (sigma-70 family)
VVNDLLRLLRHDVEGLIATWGHARHLNREDVKDAQQEVWLRLPPAVLDFDEKRLTQAEGRCEGKTFVDLIVHGLFVDFLRKERRRQRHFEASVSVEAVLEGGRAPRRGQADSPDLLSQQQELWASYSVIYARMSADERTIWDDRLDGISPAVTAKKLGISVRRVYYLRGKLQERLQGQMRAFDPAG